MLPKTIEVSFDDLSQVLQEGSGKLRSNAYVRLVDQTTAIRMKEKLAEKRSRHASPGLLRGDPGWVLDDDKESL